MIRVRREVPADHERVYAIHDTAFGQPDEANLVDTLRAAAHPQLSLVAEINGRAVGHIFFSPVSIESALDAPPMAGLAPVAVDPAHQRGGIGSALVRDGLERCPQHGWQAVFLVGNPTYYARFGFILAAPRGFTYGDPHFDAALQVLELTPHALDGLRGRVRYQPAFGQTDGG